MTVRRIVPNVSTDDVAAARNFFVDFLGLTSVMDLGWITTLSGETAQPLQISAASQGGSGAPVPALSVEVDDVDHYHERAAELGLEISYPLTDEPWGVRRFYVRGPGGIDVNILSHSQ